MAQKCVKWHIKFSLPSKSQSVEENTVTVCVSFQTHSVHMTTYRYVHVWIFQCAFPYFQLTIQRGHRSLLAHQRHHLLQWIHGWVGPIYGTCPMTGTSLGFFVLLLPTTLQWTSCLMTFWGSKFSSHCNCHSVKSFTEEEMGTQGPGCLLVSHS